jgi:integrase/recombinase XerD
LRHTLATQAINPGMSLDAIAALLGHKTLAMTMIYARIADKTVAEEYFAVTEKVEALYDQPRRLPGDNEGSEMRKLRGEMRRRMLGNGYCARPVEMDCHFESICESCTFFVTTIEFKPTLRKQREDAVAKGQLGRQKSSTASSTASRTTRHDNMLDTITRISTTAPGCTARSAT